MIEVAADHIVKTDEDLVPADDMIVSPGEVLEDALNARGLTPKEPADIMGRPVEIIDGIIAGTEKITAAIAMDLGDALGTSAQVWIGMEAGYRTALARLDG